MPNPRRLIKKNALDNWAFFRLNIGLSDEEYFQSTSAQLTALAGQYSKNQNQETARFAALMSLFANIHRKKGQRQFKPSDFIQRPQPENSTNWKQQKAYLKSIFGPN